jgi:SH3 domain protein
LRSKQQQTLAIEAELAEVRAAYKRAREEYERLEQDSKDTVTLRKQIEELQSRVLGREREIQTLQQEIELIEDRSGRDWFLIGALVVLIGVGVGLLIGRMGGGRKTNSENW